MRSLRVPRIPTPEQVAARLIRDGLDPMAIDHSLRFRRVSTGYPHAVAMAFDRDLAAAAAATDEEVAAAVAEWECAQGLVPLDWQAVGREERG